MIISPPFLLPVGQGFTDDSFDSNYVMRCMSPPALGSGLFPLSANSQWHGGIHIQSPEPETPIPADRIPRHAVRAIADGEVVYVRQPTKKPATAEELSAHPLFNPSPEFGGWVDDGCVVLKHTTEIGDEQETASDNLITFYSVYMHLNNISTTVKQGKNIHRKDQLGLPGSIYSENNVIHFEIISDDANFNKIVGSHFPQSRENFLQQDGREKCCFGAIYFYLPKDTPTYKIGTGTDAGKCVATGHTLDQELILKMRYHRGHCYMSTHNMDGLIVGAEIKDTVLDNKQTNNNNARADKRDEYDLYNNASRLYPSNPSAGFELLRFGRVLSNEVFPNNDCPPHWRKIPVLYAEGQGVVWVNLNTDAIKKYSDADFPFWESWGADQSDTNGDSRCDGTYIHSILNRGGNSFSTLAKEKKVNRLLLPVTQQKLKHTFCKFPSDWAYDEASFQARYGWMLEGQHVDENWFKKHIQAQAFWSEANIGLDQNHWHLPPITFIQLMRKCCWLSDSEFKQILPSNIIRTNNQRKEVWEEVNMNDRVRKSLIARYRIPMNQTLRKYCINTPLRLAGFLGNATQETQWFRAVAEGNPQAWWYYPWHGRGFLQLTHPDNYRDYWHYRGRVLPAAFISKLIPDYQRVARLDGPARKAQRGPYQDGQFPAFTNTLFKWREEVGNNQSIGEESEKLLSPSDSAGFYWIFGGMMKEADQPHRLERVTVNINQAQKYYYRSIAFWRVSTIVNLPRIINRTNYRGLNGFNERCSAFGNLLAVLSEVKLPDAQGNFTVEFPQGYTPQGVDQ